MSQVILINSFSFLAELADPEKAEVVILDALVKSSFIQRSPPSPTQLSYLNQKPTKFYLISAYSAIGSPRYCLPKEIPSVVYLRTILLEKKEENH